MWIKNKQARIDDDLHQIELDITSLLANSYNGILSSGDLAQLTQLRTRRKMILNHSLLTWQLKIRTKWDLLGDSNKK